MSYGSGSLQFGDSLYWPGFPELVRVTPWQLQIQVQSGFATILGRGLQFLFRDLLCGNLKSIAPDGSDANALVKGTSHETNLVASSANWPAGDWCPVPDDLILMENQFHKDYLAREALTFFGRLGRLRDDSFILGFTSHWYRIQAMEGEGGTLSADICTGRLRLGGMRGFTTLPPASFLEPAAVLRYRVTRIERIDPNPNLIQTLEVLESFKSQPAIFQKRSPDSRDLPSDGFDLD